MNKKFQYLLLIILPLFLIIFSFILRQAQGPLFLNRLYDPVYVYLISSLNLSQFAGVAHVDHPGTTVQILGAIVIKTFHLISGKSSNIVADVLKDPETYINAIISTLVLINSIVLFLAGYSIFKTTGNIFISLLLQLSPFASFTIFYELSVITTENFLMSVNLVLLAISIKFIYTDVQTSSKNYHFLIFFSLICGLGLATKLTFISLIIIPLILLHGFKKKLLFLTFTFVFFLIFVLPAISNYDYFFNWVKGLFIYDSNFGKGNPGIIDTSNFIIHLKEILSTEIFFTYTYLLILIFILYRVFINKKSVYHQYEFKFLISIFFVMTFQILIVSKQYSGHYMIPALMFCITGLYLVISTFSKMYPSRFVKKNLNYIYLVLSVTIFIIAVTEAVNNINNIKKERDEAITLNKFITDNYPDSKVISSYGSSSIEYALLFSTKWAGSQKTKYMNFLNKLYPDKLFYDYWDDKIYSFSDSKIEGNIINPGEKILFQNKYSESNEKFISDVKKSKIFISPGLVKVFCSPNGECVYEIVSDLDSAGRK